MKNTKWQIADEGYKESYYFVHRVFSLSDDEIAPANGYGKTTEEAKANAQAISALPELLEAAELLVKWDNSHDDVHLISTACSLAREAIKRTKGD